MKQRKPITLKSAQRTTMICTFGTLGIAAVFLTVNWHITVAMVFSFLAGWCGMYAVAQAEKLKVNPRPTRESIKSYLETMKDVHSKAKTQ